ncbi:hypothetical protein L596_003871 [Steinernema carpocapsae]|uniref:MAM domain-containing protein n=1 Tax=Steinernema carpocapsae TaxID=34508 RepID=A0A4U8UVL2_STECR|nr:hypothetical protein L596_003871 [Steinernema carpocapsae]
MMRDHNLLLRLNLGGEVCRDYRRSQIAWKSSPVNVLSIYIPCLGTEAKRRHGSICDQETTSDDESQVLHFVRRLNSDRARGNPAFLELELRLQPAVQMAEWDRPRGFWRVAVSNIAAMDTHRQIESMHSGSSDEFAYTFGMSGRQSAILISDVINCQLGGAKLKMWYWKTDATTTLEVCVRQPPGNPDPSKLHCYNALTGIHAQQWIYIAVELPPISQPFELVIRAFFTQPIDIIAIDDISYDAILCGEQKAERRRRRATENLPVIGVRDWEELKKATKNQNLPTMLVVAEPEMSIEKTEKEHSSEKKNLPQHSLSATEEPWTTVEATTTFVKTTSAPIATSLNSNQTVDHMNNLVNFLRQAAPLLPVLPALVRSLHSTDSSQFAPTARPDPLQGLMQLAGLSSPQHSLAPPVAAGTPIYSNRRENASESMTAPIAFTGLSNLMNKLGTAATSNYGTPLPNYGSPDLTRQASQEAFEEPEGSSGFVTESSATTLQSSTVYPAKIANLYGVQQTRVTKKVDEQYMAPLKTARKIDSELPRSSEDNLDISSLTPNEIKQLEAIHRKIFNGHNSEPSLVNKAALQLVRTCDSSARNRQGRTLTGR